MTWPTFRRWKLFVGVSVIQQEQVKSGITELSVPIHLSESLLRIKQHNDCHSCFIKNNKKILRGKLGPSACRCWSQQSVSVSGTEKEMASSYQLWAVLRQQLNPDGVLMNLSSIGLSSMKGHKMLKPSKPDGVKMTLVFFHPTFRLFYGLPSRLFYIAHLEHCTIQYLEYFSTHYGSLQSSLCFSHLQSNLIYRSDCTLCSVKRLYLCYLTVTKKKWWIQPQKADKHSIHRRKINKKVTDLPPLGADYTLLKNCKQKFMYKNVSQTWRNVSET